MNKSRLEAFSDGVFAILITILMLELKIPKEATLEALEPVAPVFLTYVLSFIYIGIYWNNHHHMLHATTRKGYLSPALYPHPSSRSDFLSLITGWPTPFTFLLPDSG